MKYKFSTCLFSAYALHSQHLKKPSRRPENAPCRFVLLFVSVLV